MALKQCLFSKCDTLSHMIQLSWRIFENEKKISFFPYGNKVRFMKSWLLKKLDSSIKAFVFESSAIAPLCQICPKIYKWSDLCCVCVRSLVCASAASNSRKTSKCYIIDYLQNFQIESCTCLPRRFLSIPNAHTFFFEYLNYFSRSITPKFLQSYSTILLQIKKQLKSPAFRMSYYLCPISCKLTCKKNLSLIYY